MANGGKIYLLSGEQNQLTEMSEANYDSEEVLQKHLASYPYLLAGEQIRSDVPLKWLLIKREMGIPGAEAEGDRWTLDHLFVDQDGVPTFVECKRSTDTRIRREVVGQMLDYAANAVTYWPIEKLRQSAAETALNAKMDLDQAISSLLEIAPDEDREEAIEEFWKRVEENLHEGRLRLLFVGDHIPRELRRVVEFLNQQMSETEVIAIEVKQYKGSGQTALVPRVLGLSESVQRRKEQKTRRAIAWTKDEFLENFHSRTLPAELTETVDALLKLAEQLSSEGLIDIAWGKGRESGSFSFKHQDSNYISVYSSGGIAVNMGYWKHPAQTCDVVAADLGKKLGFELRYDPHSFPNIASQILAAGNGVKKIEEWLRYAVQLSKATAGENANS